MPLSHSFALMKGNWDKVREKELAENCYVSLRRRQMFFTSSVWYKNIIWPKKKKRNLQRQICMFLSLQIDRYHTEEVKVSYPYIWWSRKIRSEGQLTLLTPVRSLKALNIYGFLTGRSWHDPHSTENRPTALKNKNKKKAKTKVWNDKYL